MGNPKENDIKKHCDENGGKLMPVVNFNSCGAKKDCVEICPYEVFEMRPIGPEEKANLNFKGKIKTFFFKEKAYVDDPGLCHACGLCVTACPEKAIKLAKIHAIESLRPKIESWNVKNL